MDLSKNNLFSKDDVINYIPLTEIRKKVPVSELLESSGDFSSSMLHFIMETEDNSIQREVYDSYII